MTKFTPTQLEAYRMMSDFYRDTSQSCLVIHGYAGSGKTTLLTAFALEHPGVRIVAPTGKAASVRAAKSGLPATTIHHLFYVLREKLINPETGKPVLIFEEKHPESALMGQLVLLDECSMVSMAMAHDLLVSGARIIAFGDPAQLPPVAGQQAFSEAGYTLTEVHRQAAESAVVRQATAVRNTGLYVADTDDCRIVPYLDDAELLAADAVLCFRNNTRHQLNKRVRKLKGLSGNPKQGEQVLCLKNAKRYGIFNDALYTLARDVNPLAPYAPLTISLLMDGEQRDIPMAGFVEARGELKDFDDQDITTAFDFGYVMTGHKAQSGEWDRVAVIDECIRPDVRKPWLYTCLTRAAKSVIIQR